MSGIRLALLDEFLLRKSSGELIDHYLLEVPAGKVLLRG